MAYFDEPSGAAAVAVRALASYFSPGLCYTGSHFDLLAAGSPPDHYTATDFLAVTTLSVDVPPRAALALLGQAGVVPAEVADPHVSLWEAPELLDRDGPVWRWWDRVDRHWGLGRTKTSKLLAVKRPHLVPVYDAFVDQALGLGPNYWAFWQEVARSPEAPGLVDRVLAVGAAAEVPRSVSTLRIIDVVVWMRQHGWAAHPSACSTCDLDGVRPLGVTPGL